jgi:hypothetical protein
MGHRDERAGRSETDCDAAAGANEAADHTGAIHRGTRIPVSIERSNIRQRIVWVHVCVYAMPLSRCLCALRVERTDMQRICCNAEG